MRFEPVVLYAVIEVLDSFKTTFYKTEQEARERFDQLKMLEMRCGLYIVESDKCVFLTLVDVLNHETPRWRRVQVIDDLNVQHRIVTTCLPSDSYDGL